MTRALCCVLAAVSPPPGRNHFLLAPPLQVKPFVTSGPLHVLFPLMGSTFLHFLLGRLLFLHYVFPPLRGLPWTSHPLPHSIY